MQKMTRACPNGRGHYIPLDAGRDFTEFRITHAGAAGTCLFGEPVDRLAKYEELGYEPKELAEILKAAAVFHLLPAQKKAL